MKSLTKYLLSSFAYLFLFLMAVCCIQNAEAQNTYGTVRVDGALSEWNEGDRLDLSPWQGTSGDAVYNRFAQNNYLIGIRSGLITAGSTLTIWINTDKNSSTGFQIFGFAGGVENKIVITAGSPSTATLYSYSNYATGATVAVAALDVAAVNGSLEIAIPQALLAGNPPSVNLLFSLPGDVRYLPADFSQFQYTANAAARAARTDFGKRVGIVYSATTAQRYFDLKGYSQLFMSAQHEAMMAGVPFDLLTEDQLLDVHNVVNYDALIFPLFSYVKASQRDAIEQVLTDAAFRYHIGIITSGDFMTNNETGGVLAGDPYRTMKNVLGLAPVGGAGPVALSLVPAQITHPAMKQYALSDVLVQYPSVFYRYFTASPGHVVTPIVNQKIGSTSYPAVQVSEFGGRNAHFAIDQYLGDSKLCWSILQWSIYNQSIPVALQMGRQDSIFFPRNDMDQSQFPEDFNTVNLPLETLLTNWKNLYNFDGSLYINIGNNPSGGASTNWNISGPYYRRLMSLGNEIGDHSYTHPDDTNILTNAQIAFEFNQSKLVIQQQLGLTGISAAVPGNPDSLATAQRIEAAAHFPYLSGGFSGFGAGFPGAFGYLTPTSQMVYFSPNLTPDFTMIEFKHETAAQAELQWKNEFASNIKFGSQPIIHLMWHDYGPTTGLANGYSVRMYDELFKSAYNAHSEFVTGQDLYQRIVSLLNSSLTASNPLIATVQGSNLGTFSLLYDAKATNGQVISRVANWYAYNKQRVFLPDNGGTFTTTLGAAPDNLTHITALPMRARLTSLSGNGRDLSFVFNGEGVVEVTTQHDPALVYTITGADGIQQSGDIYSLTFNNTGSHTVNITGAVPPPVCGDRIIGGNEQCDDGNASPGDGCSATCTIETGYTCSGTPSVCVPKCGDGKIIAPEQCDDANASSLDGCSSQCVIEPGYTCQGTPSVCTKAPKTLTIYSIGTEDGWVLESGQTTSVGGTFAAGGTGSNALRIGDDVNNKAYRSVLSFNTGVIPDNAKVLSVTLLLKRGATVGQPFANLGKGTVQMKNGIFGNVSGLEARDFQASPTSSTAVGTFTNQGGTGTLYSIPLTAASYTQLNFLGRTQLKLKFATDDNKNRVIDYAGFYSGRATNVADRPRLVVSYSD